MTESNAAFLRGGGEMGALMRQHDWSATRLGDVEGWPQSLRSAVSALINSTVLGAVLWGPDLLFLYNDAYIPSLADRHPAALGRPVSDVWGDAWDHVSAPFYRCMQTGDGFENREVELQMVRHDVLETTYWDFSAAPIRGESGEVAGLLNQGIEITARVVAERQRDTAEQDLLAVNAGLAAIVEERTQERDRLWRNTQDIQVVIDGAGVFQAINPAFSAILGWQPEDVIGCTVFDFLIADDEVPTEGALQHAREQTLAHFENRYRHKDGGYRWIAWVATPEAGLIYASGRHVTAEKEQASALHLYHNIVESDAAPVCAFDTDFRLIAFNQAHNDEFFRVNGFHTKLGDVFPELFLPEQRPVMRALMARALAGESFTEVEEFGNPERSKPHWEISYTPLRDASGKIIGAFHQARDISGRLRAEAELQVARDALRQSQKMEAVGQLTGGLAHDFNNLLTGMMGNLELLQARVARGRLDDLDRFINAAQGAGRRAAALTQRLLAFSRRQTPDPRPTDVNRLIGGLEEMLRRTVGATVDMEFVGAAGLWTADIDAGQLENAILNLCINGRDAMPEGGKLTIETANKWLDSRASQDRDLPAGQYISICVTDNGTGMADAVIERAFEPFYTTKPLGQGTGLGLSMIYGFARQSGGQVRIYSELGHGTTICIYLPRHHGDADDLASGDQNLPLANADGQTVLVVDDEATIRHLIDEVLDDIGYTVIGAADGAAGLKVLQSGARIELLITDVGLPNGMNGRQVADAARLLRPNLKVLFITGFAENAAVGNGHLEPGMELLTKPFTLEALANKVAEMMKSS